MKRQRGRIANYHSHRRQYSSSNGARNSDCRGTAGSILYLARTEAPTAPRWNLGNPETGRGRTVCHGYRQEMWLPVSVVLVSGMGYLEGFQLPAPLRPCRSSHRSCCHC